jgi:hypothetical protein
MSIATNTGIFMNTKTITSMGTTIMDITIITIAMR